MAGLEVFNAGCGYAKSLKSCPTLCDPMDFSLPAPYAHGILQERILEWGCHAFLQGTFPTQALSMCFLRLLQWQSESEVTQSRLTLCDPMDCSPPGSSIHGIFQARILEWVAISFFRGSC